LLRRWNRRRNASLRVDKRADPDAGELLHDVEVEMAARHPAPTGRKTIVRGTDTDLNEELDAWRASGRELLQRWALRKGPMPRVSFCEALFFEFAEVLARDEGLLMANMVGRGVSRAAPQLARQRTAQF
jgi:hypothetical protein